MNVSQIQILLWKFQKSFRYSLQNDIETQTAEKFSSAQYASTVTLTSKQYRSRNSQTKIRTNI